MGFKMKGLKDLNRFLKDVEKKAKEASGDVSFDELFTPEFMRTNSKFNNIVEFIKNSPFEIKTQEDLKQINVQELDQYVKEVTKFASWEEMKSKAGTFYMEKKLDL